MGIDNDIKNNERAARTFNKEDYISMKKVAIYLMITIILCFLIIPFIINFLFEITIPIKIFQAKWGANDILIYTAGVLSFIGTMFLGWVSWKQNQVLQKKQDDNFIAENSCMVLINSIEFKSMSQKAVNLDIHPETIVVTNSAKITESFFDYASFECIIEFKHIKGYPVIVRVIDAFLQVNMCILKFNEYDNCFTKIAISQEFSRFQLTFITTQSEKNEFKLNISNETAIFLSIKLEVVTDKYVSTILTCKNKLVLTERNNEMIYTSIPKDAMSFWNGNSILTSDLIRYRRDKQEETNNDQTKNANA